VLFRRNIWLLRSPLDCEGFCHYPKILKAITMPTKADVSLSSYDEGYESKLILKAKEALFDTVGVAGFAAIVAYGLSKQKSRGKTKCPPADLPEHGSPRLCCGSNDCMGNSGQNLNLRRRDAVLVLLEVPAFS
jgi:hypothetical protein